MFDGLANIQNWLSSEEVKMNDLNICNRKNLWLFDIQTQFFRSSEVFIGKEPNASDRLVKLTKAVGGNEYFSGLGAKKYQEERPFSSKHQLYSSFVEDLEQASTCFKKGRAF